nr:hypothetical protein [Curtobacterium sp. Csp2]
MSLIDPSKLPGDKIDAAAVSSGASTISTLGTTIATGGGDTVRAWQAISGSYQSDGAEHLYSVMTPVGTATTSVGDGLGCVAAALSTYAETVGPIKTELDTLKTEAEDFVRRAKDFQPRMQDSDDGYVIASQAVSTMGVSLITGTKVEITSWDQDPDMVDENNRLIRRGADLAEEWLAAQQTCANAILAAACLAPLPGTSTGTPAQIMAAAEASLPWAGESDIDTPWGSTRDRKESCGEKAAGFPAHLVKGVVVDGLGGMAKGLSSLLIGWDGTGIPWYAEAIVGGITGRSDMVDDAFGRAGQTYGGARLGLGHLASALTPVGTVVNTLGNSPLGDFLPKDTQQFLSDWGHDDTTALADTVGGLVGLKLPDQWWESSSWDGYDIAQSWVDDPGGTAGASAFNIGTLFIPGAGEASAGAHATAAAADAAGDVARAGGFVDDAARAARGADGFVDAARGVTIGDLADVAKGVDAGDVAKIAREGDLPTTSVDLAGDAGKVDVPTPHADAPSAPLRTSRLCARTRRPPPPRTPMPRRRLHPVLRRRRRTPMRRRHRTSTHRTPATVTRRPSSVARRRPLRTTSRRPLSTATRRPLRTATRPRRPTGTPRPACTTTHRAPRTATTPRQLRTGTPLPRTTHRRPRTWGTTASSGRCASTTPAARGRGTPTSTTRRSRGTRGTRSTAASGSTRPTSTHGSCTPRVTSTRWSRSSRTGLGTVGNRLPREGRTVCVSTTAATSSRRSSAVRVRASTSRRSGARSTTERTRPSRTSGRRRSTPADRSVSK